VAAFETRNLNVFVAAQIDDGDVHEVHTVTVIPPGYDAMDVRAVTVRKIEDAAFALTRRDYNRAPTLQALIAAVARVRAIQEVIDETTTPDAAGLTYLRVRIRQIIDMSNDEATALFGEDPEGL
jgi:hypothetical protein